MDFASDRQCRCRHASALREQMPDTPARHTVTDATPGTLVTTGFFARRQEGMAVYRVFEALDELGAIVEEARGVPMTSGCVVPRGDVLELIDDIKDAIPGELDDAQDVLDARDSMLQDAKAHAESMVSSATTESESMLNHARAEADRLLSDAKAQADRMVSEARQHSERTVGEAREESIRIATAAKREYEASISRAQAECDRLIENGNISYEM